MKILNSLIVPKNVKGEPFGIFLTSILLQNIKKNEGRHFGAIKQFSKRSLIVPKKSKLKTPR